MPQGEHIELHRKRYGRQLDHEERTRKKEARSVKKRSAMAQRTLGLKGKMFAKERAKEKATMKKTIAMHEERDKKHKADDGATGAAVPAYLLEREQTERAKVLSNTIKQKRKEKAGKWDVPLPKVRPVAEEEMFKVLRTGTTAQVHSQAQHGPAHSTSKPNPTSPYPTSPYPTLPSSAIPYPALPYPTPSYHRQRR